MNTVYGTTYQGVLDVSVGTRGKHNISYYHFKASYAHKKAVISASIGLDYSRTPSIGFSLGYGFNEVVYRYVSMTPRGKVIREPDDK